MKLETLHFNLLWLTWAHMIFSNDHVYRHRDTAIQRKQYIPHPGCTDMHLWEESLRNLIHWFETWPCHWQAASVYLLDCSYPTCRVMVTRLPWSTCMHGLRCRWVELCSMLSENLITDSNHKKPDYVTAPEIVPQGGKIEWETPHLCFPIALYAGLHAGGCVWVNKMSHCLLGIKLLWRQSLH